MTGSTVTITAGGYTAAIGLRGGQLLSLTSTDPYSGTPQNLIVPADRVEDSAFAGAVLAPWPNRIAKASYTFGDTTYELTPNEESTESAIHGLFYAVDFEIQSQRDSEVHLHGVLEPSEGYPFRLEAALVYRVGAGLGLTASLSVRYRPLEEDAAAAAPFGAGFHPYLTAGDAPLKACRLKLPAATVAKTKPNGEVTNRGPVTGDFDLTDSPLLAGLSIDHAYTDLPEEGWSAELLHGPSGLMVRMISDTPWAQVYTGENVGRSGVAVEPMTCPPNAFNSGENLVELTPEGGWHRVGYSIEAFRL